MDKRQFLKTSGVFLAGTMLSHVSRGEGEAGTRTNWSGNYTYSTRRLHEPRSIEEVQQVVKGCSHVRALGSRHSFNGIADSMSDQISLAHLDTMTLDRAAHTVTVGGGVTYSQLAPWLDRQGFALHNLASLPGITIPGAIATATHGSGNRNGNLATAVSSLEFISAKGEVVTLSRLGDGELFKGVVVNLGAVGIATKVTLDVLPSYQVAQTVYENLPMDVLEHHLEEIFASGYSVSLFTDWQQHRINQVWIKRKIEPDRPSAFAPEFYGARKASKRMHPLADHPADSCTEQLGIPGPWYDRLPHFRIGETPSSGAELQSEYLIPREHGYAAILAVEALRAQIGPHLFITELRTVAPDDLWMSTAYERPSLGIHFTWKPEWPAVKTILPQIESRLAPFQPRPHWGKLFTMQPEQIQRTYPQRAQYAGLLAHYDPQGKFRNQFVNANILGN